MNSPVHQNRREPISRESLMNRRSSPAMKMTLFRRDNVANKDAMCPSAHIAMGRFTTRPARETHLLRTHQQLDLGVGN